MTFSSLVFVAFFLIFYPMYLATMRHLRVQNTLLLVASLFFYGWWDWRFLSLLLVSTLIDYYAAIGVEQSPAGRKRKAMVVVSMAANLTILGVFKYFNFFSVTFAAALRTLGFQVNPLVLDIVLPLGISFYTFQSMGYVIDVYRGDLKALRSFPMFVLFVTFFPHMVAGPIQRSTKLIGQCQVPRRIDIAQVEAAIGLILWGYFKKVVVADNVAKVSDTVFNGYTQFHGVDLVIGALAFTVQIYCDFSGYTDIARGLAKLMGFELMLNFKIPYFATSPSDFWTRWHISLSTWLRDYLYIPLGGNRGSRLKTYRNLVLTMVIGGFWHGASWNFILWGCYHGAILVVYRLIGELRSPKGGMNENTIESRVSVFGLAMRIAVMFVLTVIGWVLFRAKSVDQIVYMFGHLGLTTSATTRAMAHSLIFFSVPLVLGDVFMFMRERGQLISARWESFGSRALVYSFLILWIFVFGVRTSAEFIYFQF